MWVPPPDVGPKYIPSIKDVWSLRRVGIGADVPSGSRTLKCDGAISPDGSVMGVIDFDKDFNVLNFAHPWSYQ
jgi:hypothetical protein